MTFYLPEPFDLEDLVSIIERLARASRSRREVKEDVHQDLW